MMFEDLGHGMCFFKYEVRKIDKMKVETSNHGGLVSLSVCVYPELVLQPTKQRQKTGSHQSDLSILNPWLITGITLAVLLLGHS